MTARESYSLRCTARECRYACLFVPSLPEARDLARQHAAEGHAVEIHRETVRLVEMIGGAG